MKLCIRELVAAVGGRLNLGSMPPVAGDLAPLGRIVTDSRQVKPGDIFWGLRGSRENGSHYAEDAFLRGAAGVVVAGRKLEPWAGAFSLEVEDTVEALWKLATAVRRRFRGTVIGVTGSVGKTTTRDMIHTALGCRLNGAVSPANWNNQLGLPLSLLELEEDHDYGVFEHGADRRGEISLLAAISRPEIGVLTPIGLAHLGRFGDQRTIAETKGELLDALPNHGIAVLQGEDPWHQWLAQRCRSNVVWYGTGERGAMMRGSRAKLTPNGISLCIEGELFRVPVWGRHFGQAVLAAVAVGRTFGLRLRDMADALVEFSQQPNRCEKISIDGITWINDTYNSSPTAFDAALELLVELPGNGRRVAVCGDMAELGAASPDFHEQLGKRLVERGVQAVLAIGDDAEHLLRGAREAGLDSRYTARCRSVEEIWKHLSPELHAGDLVLVKGARKLQLDRLFELVAPQRRAIAA